MLSKMFIIFFFFFQAEDGIRYIGVTGVQTCALPISGAVEGADPRPRVELRLQRRGQCCGVLHLLPAPQDRHDRAPPAAHHPGGRLHAPPAAGSMTAPSPPPIRSGPRVPLRITLVALLVALVGLALLATGLATTSLLRDYLTDQQDDALRSTVREENPAVWRACLDGEYRATPREAYFACLPPDTDALVTIQGPYDEEGIPLVDPDDVAEGDYARSPETVRAADGTSWRVMSGRLPGDYTLTARSHLESDQTAISRLLRIALSGAPAALHLLG